MRTPTADLTVAIRVLGIDATMAIQPGSLVPGVLLHGVLSWSHSTIRSSRWGSLRLGRNFRLESVASAIKAFALSLGCDRVGIASAEPFEAEEAVLAERARLGYRSPFEPRGPEARTRPERMLPGVCSIIAYAVAYGEPSFEPAGAVPRVAPRKVANGGALHHAGPSDPAWISRYARGRDYHHVLRQIGRRIADFLAELDPNARSVVAVDTDPPLDRALAVRAGIGWIGKNGMLISHPHGSWLFLGAVLTTLELEPDVPQLFDCGDCRICLDACPTGALTEPYVLDASRCVSQWTQEKGFLPEAQRLAFGHRTWGCDTCQDVCPHNRRARPGRSAEALAPWPEVSLARLARLSSADFQRRFQPTAAGWRGRTTLSRNALIALANGGRPEALEVFLESLCDERPVIRGHAAWGIGRLAGSLMVEARRRARAALEAACAREKSRPQPDRLVLGEIERALALFNG